MPSRAKIVVPRMPKVGDTVMIIIKPYERKRMITGKVATVLTKKKYHNRGHKVKLITGETGRIIKILI